MDITNLNVTIIGAAIGGCTAALLLARAGATVTLIEKVATPRAVGAGIGLADNGLAVLASLGLEPTNPIARAVRDRVLMPLAQRAASPTTQAFVMQEPLTLLRHTPG